MVDAALEGVELGEVIVGRAVVRQVRADVLADLSGGIHRRVPRAVRHHLIAVSRAWAATLPPTRGRRGLAVDLRGLESGETGEVGSALDRIRRGEVRGRVVGVGLARSQAGLLVVREYAATRLGHLGTVEVAGPIDAAVDPLDGRGGAVGRLRGGAARVGHAAVERIAIEITHGSPGPKPLVAGRYTALLGVAAGLAERLLRRAPVRGRGRRWSAR